MLQSMTGFGRGESVNETYRVVVEIKSVNNRFKDFRFKMGSVFSSAEMELKELITRKLKRGSFEISVNYKKISAQDMSFRLDNNKIAGFISQISAIEKDCDRTIDFRATDFLRAEFQEEIDHDDVFNQVYPVMKEAFNKALESIEKVRLSEGEKIKTTLMGYVKEYEEEFQQIKSLKSEYRKGVENNLTEKLNQYKEKIDIDKQRMLQEVIYYLEKLDIDEEIDRIIFHLSSMMKLLSSNSSEVGRKIDFLLQELNRETNTIGSKSGSKSISNHVVNMKSFLEKVREQGLNLQ